MKGTVKSVSRTSGTNAVTISVTDPPPPHEESLLNVEQWIYDDLRAALVGKLPVDIVKNPDGSVLSVKVG